MKVIVIVAIVVATLSLGAASTVPLPTFNGKCVTCTLQNALNYYCVKASICSSVALIGESCY